MTGPDGVIDGVADFHFLLLDDVKPRGLEQQGEVSFVRYCRLVYSGWFCILHFLFSIFGR